MDGLAESLGLAAAAVPRENWSGNYHYSTNKVMQPGSVEEVRDAVRSVAGVRALGTRHAFNGIADSQVAQISTLGLKDVAIAGDRKTVTVGAGIRYGDLAVMLDAQGLALHNLASLPHISVGGAVATATHGSGMGEWEPGHGGYGCEFVGADGAVHRLSRAPGWGAVCGECCRAWGVGGSDAADAGGAASV